MHCPHSRRLPHNTNASSPRRFRRLLGVVLILMAACVVDRVHAQMPQIRLTSIHPAGAQKGAAVDVTIAGGTDLDEAGGLYFSHPGITAVQKTQMVDGKPQPIANQFTVTIAGDVPAGVYDLRVRGLFGLSNPRTFSVVERKSILEAEPNNQPEKAQPVELNTVVFGRSDGGADIDWYKFTAQAGQRVLAEVVTGRIDSRMEAVLELYAGGRRLLRHAPAGYSDVVIDFTAPADGEYLLRIHDRVFGGSAEYPYQLTVHTGPRLEFILPASGLPGPTSEFTLYGRNLPGGKPSQVKGADGRALETLEVPISLTGDRTTLSPAGTVRASESNIDAVTFALGSPQGASNPVNIYFATAPTLVEAEPNDTPDKAQKISVPAEVTGQFQARRDTDLYQFDAKAGEVYWIEVFGQRDGNPADPMFVLDAVKVDDKGQETVTRVIAADDNPTNIGGALFNTTSDDPVFRFAVPAEGTYRVTVRDRSFENRGDPSMVYRLAIRREAPDFRLVAIPVFPNPDPNQQAGTWDLSLRKGDTVHLLVMAHRRDGFAGDIRVTAEGLPEGVTTAGAHIAGNQNSATLVLHSTESAPEWAGAIRVVGRAPLYAPAKVKAVADAEAARLAAVQALPALIKGVTDTEVALKAATDNAAKAKEALDKDPNNASLQSARTAADAAATKAAEASRAALDNKAAGERKIADANAIVQSTRLQREMGAAELVREARGGTIVWSGNPGAQQAAESRLTRSLTMAVLRETARYQVLTDAVKFSVNAGSQVLLPLKLAKRAGFDENVNVTFVGPIPNLQVENKPIAKGTADGLYRLYFQNNVVPGTYTLFAQSQAQISYSRNPEAAAAAAKEKEDTDKLAAAAAEAAKQAADAKAVADKKAVDTAAAAKAAADAKAVADKLAFDTAAAAKTAADEKAVADKGVVDADAANKAAVDKQAKAVEALDKDANNEGLKKAKADADAEVAKAAEVLQKAKDAKVAADKKAADAAEVAKKAAEAKVVSDKAAADSDVLAKKAVEEKAAADKLAADTDARNKALAAAKAAADKRATDTANVAKPANLNVFSPAAAITVTVRPPPGTLAVTVANGGAVKRGAAVEAKVTVNRANGFSGPVTLSLPSPPGVSGLTAEPVTVPADKTEGTLMIQAAAEATMGQLPNLVVRASMDFDGPSAIDQPVAINVQQ